MNLILQKDVKNLGKTGDQVSVKKGFARNYLIPKGYAVLVNKSSLKAWDHQKVIIEAKKRKAVSERKTLIEKLSFIKLKFEKEAQKDNRLFGSVTAHEISQALETLHNLSVDKKDIHFTELKTVGEHAISIQLDSQNQTEIKLSIKGKVRKTEYEPTAPEVFATIETKPEEKEETSDLQEKTQTEKNLEEKPILEDESSQEDSEKLFKTTSEQSLEVESIKQSEEKSANESTKESEWNLEKKTPSAESLDTQDDSLAKQSEENKLSFDKDDLEESTKEVQSDQEDKESNTSLKTETKKQSEDKILDKPLVSTETETKDEAEEPVEFQASSTNKLDETIENTWELDSTKTQLEKEELATEEAQLKDEEKKSDLKEDNPDKEEASSKKASVFGRFFKKKK